jgi:hypothetical protein
MQFTALQLHLLRTMICTSTSWINYIAPERIQRDCAVKQFKGINNNIN